MNVAIWVKREMLNVNDQPVRFLVSLKLTGTIGAFEISFIMRLILRLIFVYKKLLGRTLK